MHLFALIFALAAIAAILWSAFPHARPNPVNWFSVGVALVVAAWVCQLCAAGQIVTFG